VEVVAAQEQELPTCEFNLRRNSQCVVAKRVFVLARPNFGSGAKLPGASIAM